jgi:hypothetical protein
MLNGADITGECNLSCVRRFVFCSFSVLLITAAPAELYIIMLNLFGWRSRPKLVCNLSGIQVSRVSLTHGFKGLCKLRRQKSHSHTKPARSEPDDSSSQEHRRQAEYKRRGSRRGWQKTTDDDRLTQVWSDGDENNQSQHPRSLRLQLTAHPS